MHIAPWFRTHCPSAEALATIIIIIHDIRKQTNSSHDVI